MKVRLSGLAYNRQLLWNTAEFFHAQGVREAAGSFFPFLASSAFAFFAFEALLNELLHSIAPDTYAVERRYFADGDYQGTLGKFHYLAELVGLEIDTSKRPYQTIKVLHAERDALAHAKPEVIDKTVKLRKGETVARHQQRLVKIANRAFVERALKDTKRLCDDLVLLAREKFEGIAVGSALGAFGGTISEWTQSRAPAQRADV